MSLAHILFLPEAVVISADSLTTMRRGPAAPEAPDWLGLAPFTYASVKLHLLWGAVGVVTVGDGHLGAMPVASYIQRLENTPPQERDLMEAASVVLSALAQGGPPDQEAVVGLACFRAGRPAFLSARLSQARTQGIPMPEELAVPSERILGGRDSVERRIVRELGAASPPDFGKMKLADAVDYSRHILRTVIDQTRFGSVQLVGGEVDTLVLVPGGGKWTHRKWG